ncbi:MAG: class I adenylate-forming enzyme family protein [Gammaproteobacteria bacterium]
MQTIREQWDFSARTLGRETAFVCGDRRVGHAPHAARARRLGSALHGLGMRSQDRVSILAMNCLEFLEIYAACEIAGFIAATVNFRLAAPEVEYVVNDAAPRVLIFERQYADMIGAIRDRLRGVAHFVCIGPDAPDWSTGYEALLSSGDPAGAPLPPPLPSDVAYLIYTSGTTGRPKGCMLDHRAQALQSRLVAEVLAMSATSRTLLNMPLFHVGAKSLQLAQLRAGGQVHLQRAFDPQAVLATVQAERITHLHLAPTMVQQIIEHPAVQRYDLSTVRTICYSAAPMPAPVLRRGLELLGPVFVQLWGQTEGAGTVLSAAAHRPDGDETDQRRLVSIGHIFPETQVRIVDDEDRDLPPGTPGEMLIQGPIMMRGYWNNSAATVETLRGGWLHSGDVCTMDAAGFLYLVDRKKDVIISGGENIYSREVEEAVVRMEGVAECAVIGLPHARWGEAVCAVVVRRPGADLSPESVVAHCRTLIAGYKRPRFVAFADALPRLPSGKVSKVELRRHYAGPGALAEIGGS